MKWAPDLPAADVDSLTSMERFVFLHAIVNSAITFLSTEGGDQTNGGRFCPAASSRDTLAAREWVENACSVLTQRA